MWNNQENKIILSVCCYVYFNLKTKVYIFIIKQILEIKL